MPNDTPSGWSALHLIAFRPTQVSIWIAVTYIALLSSVFYVHLNPPPAADSPAGVDQTQAWQDLQELSKAFRPWNSERNGQVNYWLSRKIERIVAANDQPLQIIDNGKHVAGPNTSNIVLWNDDGINVTIIDPRRQSPMPAYIESQNILVYIRGTKDEAGPWWEASYTPRQGVLVNAHYDSVSTGYGATDDGCGVISILQLISYFSLNQPRHGIIFLLNDGEEDGLYGAHTFSSHPWSSFPGVFLNLEGAGAGGRAALFRSTDAEVTSFYTTPHPFGTAFTGDGFKRGLVRSDTDYTVFTADLDIRGLDVAFMEPRSRYHTNEDTAKDTSRDSLWHMLSAALATTQRLSDYDGEWKPLSAHSSDSGVWFDIYGAIWVVSSIKVFAALDITLLVVGPLIIGGLIALHVRQGRLTLARVSRGILRTPIIVLSSVLALLALSDLINSRNPLVVSRSPYAVLALFLSGFLLVSWTVARLADHIRPAIFTKWYTLLWFYVFSWIGLVISTHQAIADGMGSGYIVLVLHSTILVALLISTVEFYALASELQEPEEREEDREPDERTSLLSDRQTFRVARPQTVEVEASPPLELPSWTWLPQFLLLAINIILIGQLALLTISSLHQTPADGNSISTVYLAILALSLLITLPILPFIHKLRPTIAFLLLLVLIASTIWCTSVFPFSREARLKYFFLQRIDLDSGHNNVTITAVQPFLQGIIGELPSAAGQQLHCSPPGQGLRRGLTTCSWQGLRPDVAEGKPSTWVHHNITRTSESSAVFTFGGKQTKNCRLLFDTAIEGLEVNGALTDIRNPEVTPSGATQIRLFSRDWDTTFQVNVSWPQNGTQTGSVGCMWAELEKVPAIQELQSFAPVWSALTKQDDGLVEGWQHWEV